MDYPERKYYTLNQKLVTNLNFAKIIDIQSDINLEPISLTRGKSLEILPKKITIKLEKTNDHKLPDIFTGLITLFSKKLKDIFDDFGCENIEYHQVELLNKSGEIIGDEYWFANVTSCVSALDLEKTKVKKNILGSLKFKEFYIDSSKVSELKLFRLEEERTLLIISEEIFNRISNSEMLGVMTVETTKYDGYGF